MIAPLIASLRFLSQRGKNSDNSIKELTEDQKKEIDKINQMEFFDAIDYLSKKDK